MGLLKKMASVLVTASLLFGLVGTAFAQTPSEIQASAARMQELGIVNGDASGDLKLADSITRAQLMKIMVWAFGKKDIASILKGANAFPDTASHWASGEIAIAKNIIVEQNHFEMGMPDGTFAPEGKVTAAQAVAFLMKFIGISPDSSKTWPNNYLDAAVSAGMISADVRNSIAATANSEATRGLVFFLADTAFSSYPLTSGKTVYTTFAKANAPTLTLEAAALTTTASTITVTGTVSADAKSVFLGTTANPLPVAAGKFTFDVNLNMGANDITVGATDIVGQTTTKTLTVTRTVGVATAIDAAATLSVAAGATVDLPVAVKDAQGNVIDGAAVTTEGTIGTWADGKFTAATTIGAGEFTFKSGDLSAKVAVTVTAAALDSIAVAGSADSFAVGTAQKFTATGKDAYGNAVELSNVTWTAVGGVIDAQGNFVASTSGNVVITASANGKSGSHTAVAYGKAVALRLSTPANIVANGVSETTVTATAVDANGSTDLAFTGTASFSSNNTGVATVDDDYKSVSFVNGVATSTLVAGTGVGATTISVSVSGMPAATSILKTDKQVLTSITTSVDPASMAADTTSTARIKIKLLDQAGVRMTSTNNPLSTGSFTTPVSSNTNVAAAGSISSQAYGSATPYHFYIDVTSRGTLGSTSVSTTITGTYKDLAVPAATVSTTTVSTPSKLGIDAIADTTVGENAKVTVRVYDYNGNQNTGSNGAVTVYLNDVATNTQVATGITAAGKIVLQFTKTVAKTYNLEVTSGTLTKATGSVNFVAGDASALSLDSNPATLNANGTSQATLTATVTDAYGNAVTSGSYNVTFKKIKGTTTATQDFSDTTVATVNGEATAVITASLNDGGSDTFKVTATGLVESTLAVSSYIMGAPAKLAFNADSTSVAKTVGANAKIIVDVQDSRGVLVSTANGINVSLTVKDSDGNVVDTLSAASENGKATFTFTQTVDDVYGLTATSTGLTKVTGRTQEFTPGTAVAFKVAPSLASFGADATSRSYVKVQVADKYGNATTKGATTVNYSISNTAVGTLSGSSQSVTWTTSDADTAIYVTSTTQPGTVTVTVSDPSGVLASASADFTTISIGDPVRGSLSVSGTPVVSGSFDADSASIVTVTVVDAAGNRVTNHGNAKAILTITGKNATGTAYTTDAGLNVLVYKNSTTTLTNSNATDNGTLVYTSDSFTTGKTTFYVFDTKADQLSYSVAIQHEVSSSYVDWFAGPYTSNITIAAGSAKEIAFVAPDTAVIAGNGTSVTTLKVVARDSADNIVTDASGTVYFKLSAGNDYAALLNTSASFVNGEAIVSIQSKAVTDSKNLTIKAWTDAKQSNGTTTLWQDGSTTVSADSETNAISDSSLTVDGKAPVITGSALNLTASMANVVDGVGYTNNGQPTISWTGLGSVDTANDTDGSGLAYVAFQYRVKGATTAWTTLYEDATASSGTYAAVWDNDTPSPATSDDTSLAPNTYEFRAVAYDNAGNSVASNTYTFTVDTAKPTVSSAVYSDTAGKKLTITFGEAMDTASMDSAAEINAAIHPSASATLGTAPTVSWSTDKKTATITMDADATATNANTYTYTSVKDLAGNTIN